MTNVISKWRYGVLLLPLPLLVAVVYIVPFLAVLKWSFSEPEAGFGQYVRIATDPVIQSVLLRTLRICIIATAASVTVAYAIAYNLVFGMRTTRRLISYCVLIPFWISVLIRAFGWLLLLRNNGLINDFLVGSGILSEPLSLVRNELGSVIGIVHYLIPFAVFPLASALRQIDPRVLQAASSLGAGRFQIFWQVTMPLSVNGIIGAGIITLIFTMGFFITPAILSGGRSVMVSEYIYLQLFQTVNWGLASALSIVLVVSVALIALLTRRFLSPRQVLD